MLYWVPGLQMFLSISPYKESIFEGKAGMSTPCRRFLLMCKKIEQNNTFWSSVTWDDLCISNIRSQQRSESTSTILEVFASCPKEDPVELGNYSYRVILCDSVEPTCMNTGRSNWLEVTNQISMHAGWTERSCLT